MVIIDLVKLYMFIDLFISHSVKRTISLRNLINKLRLFNTKKKFDYLSKSNNLMNFMKQ